ncbi:MAG: SCO family protein [Aestuariivirga sp.]
MANTKSLRNALWGMVALCAAVFAYAYFSGGSNNLVSADFGAPFKLSSTKGGEVDSASLKGKPYGMFFGFTNCPEVCPTTLNDMSVAMKELGDQAKDFRLFFITVDPDRDTQDVMRDYISNFDPRIEGLVPTDQELVKITHDFHIYYKKVPTSDGSYTMDHTATLFLFGADGKLKSTLAFDEDKADQMAKLKKLMAG